MNGKQAKRLRQMARAKGSPDDREIVVLGAQTKDVLGQTITRPMHVNTPQSTRGELITLKQARRKMVRSGELSEINKKTQRAKAQKET